MSLLHEHLVLLQTFYNVVLRLLSVLLPPAWGCFGLFKPQSTECDTDSWEEDDSRLIKRLVGSVSGRRSNCW